MVISAMAAHANAVCFPFFLFFSVDADTKPTDEPKFIVFYNMLLALFELFCFLCKSPQPAVDMMTNGTMVTVIQNCRFCGPTKRFEWMSQPLVMGKHPAGNLMLSFGTIMSGVNISQMLLMLKHMGLAVITTKEGSSYESLPRTADRHISLQQTSVF